VLDRHALSFTRANGEFGAEPGLFDLWIAPSSEAGEAVQFELMGA
jgi:beta-glucosidase